MTGRPQVLVLLATRNGSDVLGRQLRSVLAQSGVDVRVEVRDDGSTDGTRDLVASIAARDLRVSLRPDHEASGSAAGNFFRLVIGARLHGVSHVAFCDQDDEWHTDKLLRATRCLAKTRSAGYSAAVVAAWSDGRRRVLVQDPNVRRADHLFEGAGQGCTFVFVTDLFRLLQFDIAAHSAHLSGLHYHDWTLYALARASHARWHFDARPSTTYHQHDWNDTGARSSVVGVERRIMLIRHGWYRAQVDAITSLLRDARPGHLPAIEWQSKRSGVFARFRRLVYVLQHGRRRLSDRVIQAIAVMLGHL